MKKLLLCLLQAALVCGFTACEKGLEDEAGFITPGNPEIPENPMWEWSDTYPGPVNPQVTKLDTVVTVIGKYKPIPYSPETPILQSTGLYVGLDEVVFIDVPANAIGLKYQVGLAHRLAADQARRRASVVTKSGALIPGEINQISSNYGGYLYFYYEPQDVQAAQHSVSVRVTDAYQSLDYFKGSDAAVQQYYVRTIKERNGKLRDTSITDDSELAFLNWTELRSPKIILTFALKEMYYLTNPDRLLQQYENLVDAFLDFGGYPPADTYELPIFRVYADIQLPNPKQTIVANSSGANDYSQDQRKYGGYPIGVLKSTNIRGTDIIDENRYMNQDDQLAFGYNNRANTVFAGTQYAFGITTYGQWATAAWMKYPLLRLANLYYCQKISNGTYWGSTGYTQALQCNNILKTNWMKSPYLNMHSGKYMWYANLYTNTEQGKKVDSNSGWDNNGGDFRGTPNQTRADYNANLEGRRMMVFMQLVQHYGWGIIRYINQRSVETGFVNEYEQDAHDFFVMAACEYADADLRPFFRWWMFPYSAHVVEFIRNQGFPELTKDYAFTANDSKTRNYYFFDYPRAGIEWFPGDRPLVTEDKWPAGTNPPRKAAVWPQKPYYKDVEKAPEKWTAYAEIIEANPNYPDPAGTGWKGPVVYNPNLMRSSSQSASGGFTTIATQAGFNSSTYIWYNSADAGDPKPGEDRNKARLLADGGWAHGTAGSLGGMKGGTGMGSNANASRGSDTTINWCIIDIDFKRPVKFNTMRTRQSLNADGNGDVMQNLMYFQYYVEPPYEWQDPADPSAPPVTIQSGSRNGVYNYDPQNDPYRVRWELWTDRPEGYSIYENPINNVPYPGRTINYSDAGTPATNVSNNRDQMVAGNWGFAPKDAQGNPTGYFALVTPRTVIKDHKKVNKPAVAMDDQDWYTGVIWFVRDTQMRSYTYYLEETIETRRVRFFLRSANNHRLGDGMSSSSDATAAGKSWRMRPYEFMFGLVSTDVPAPGTIPQPHMFFKGQESGDYPEVTARNYGGAGDNNAGW